MSMTTTPSPLTPQGAVPAIGIPNSQDYPRLVFTAPYFETVPLAELIEPSVIEAVEAALPSLVPPYVDAAAIAAVQQNAVLLTGSTMSGPLFLNPVIPTQPSQAASMAYVDALIATAGIPEVPVVPTGQVWARETGQWVPISQTEGTFLPLAGGTMTGNISMSGNTINNLAAVPTLPNGAAPAQWVLNQIASVSLYQGTWNADTNVPDLTQLMYRVNGYTWIAITTSVSGVVVGQAIPGLQGVTVYNGDTIIYSTVQGEFTSIHAGGLTLPEADARYVQLAGSQMSGALLLNANASAPLQAVTLQQMQAAVATAGIGEAPNDGQLYGRNGLTTSWAPVLPLAGGILTGALMLNANAVQPLQAVPYQQLTSTVSAAVAGYVPLGGGTMSGLLTLSGNAANALNPVPLQQINGMLGAYLPLSGGTLTGALNGTSASFAGALGTNGALTVLQGANIGGALQVATASTPGFTLQVATGDPTLFFNSQNNISLSATGINVNSAANINLVPTATGAVTIGSAALFSLADNGSYRQIIYASGYADSWQISNGTRIWLAGNAQIMTCDYGGNMHISGTLTQGSDATNKTNVSPIAQGVSLISKLIPKSFAWASSPDVTQWGFIAQDVETVIPAAVNLGLGGLLGLDTTAIMAAMAYAMQQLINRVAALEAAASITPPAAELA